MTTVTLKHFRAQYGLPESFGVAHFEPKDFAGLATIDQAGSILNQLRVALLEAIPEHVPLSELLQGVDTLQQLFRSGLIGINAQIGLSVEQLEFAVAGFGDVCQTWSYAVLRARMGKQAVPSFRHVYEAWVADSERDTIEGHAYVYQDRVWQVNVVNTVYGRIGLRVTLPNETVLVLDNALACPAEGFMASLLADVAQKILDSTTTT